MKIEDIDLNLQYAKNDFEFDDCILFDTFVSEIYWYRYERTDLDKYKLQEVRQIVRISISRYVSRTNARTYLGLLSFNFIFVLHLYWYLRKYVHRSILEEIVKWLS